MQAIVSESELKLTGIAHNALAIYIHTISVSVRDLQVQYCTLKQVREGRVNVDRGQLSPTHGLRAHLQPAEW